MAVDAELIGSEGYNLKFKNYLRDFFIYQFKERGSDFKTNGAKGKNISKNVVDGTFYPDAKRLQYALEQSTGVSWSKGDFVDIQKGDINKKRENKRVECVTVDMRQIEGNPFFSLYRFCGESTLNAGAHFSFIYTLLLYFHQGKGIKRSDFRELDSEQKENLNFCIKSHAEIIESEVNRHSPKFWTNFSDEEKETFAPEAIERFYKDHYELDEVYNYMVLNKMRPVHNNGNFSFEYDNFGYIEKNVLFDVMEQYGLEVDEKQFGNKMQELTRLGIIKCQKRGPKIYYKLSDTFINGLLDGNEDLRNRFSDCVYFFSQSGTLGEIGSYILERMTENKTEYMRFKHNYIKRALNDYNNIDLLYAIKNKLWAVVEYRNASMDDLEYQRILCYPIEIRESVTNGRQYLIYYYPGFRSVSAVRIEFIDRITLGTLPAADHFNDDLLRARNLIDHTWGTAFDGFQEGNVKEPLELKYIRVVISYGENEGFIKARLQRETRNRASLKEIETDEAGHCIEVVAEVANPWEMFQWLRSYITRVVTVEIDGNEFSGFTEDVIKTYESYVEPAPKGTKNISSRSGKSLLWDEVPEDFVCEDNMHSLLFNEIFSIPCKKLGEMLLTIIRKGIVSEDRLKRLKNDYSTRFISDQFTEVVQWDTEDRRRKQAEGFIRSFVNIDKKEASSVFVMDDTCPVNKPYDLLPLTTIEIQWLKNILSNPLAKCFLSEPEINEISARLGDVDIFDINEVILHDQFIGVEEFYQNPGFDESIKKIVKAIKTGKMVTIKYRSQYGIMSDYVCSPDHIEYSKRDNRIRIRAVTGTNLVMTFNLERVLEVIPTEKTFDRGLVKSIVEKHLKENERELVIFFNETKNVPDRILTEFSCFKKKCVKWGIGRYRMSLYYDKEDSREILVRLLSYGSLINVFNDTGDVRHELIERIEHQLELTNSIDSVLAQDYEKAE